MDFCIADTFTDSLTRLTAEEQKAVKTTAFDLQLNQANPGLGFHKLDNARDKHFWSVRVSGDIRLIVHRAPGSLLLCYVDHHDSAYAWAERRRLETHPRTGAAQWVEIRERVEVMAVSQHGEEALPALPKPALFAQCSDAQLLSYGVPAQWLAAVRLASEDSLLEVADHLPGEAAEALLQLATGGQPQVAHPLGAPGVAALAHPDAQRRFRIIGDPGELERALEVPWDKWTVFLHPAQRDWVERSFAGPARVCGSAGTGKTIVALHRAVFLARAYPDSRILLTTFSALLANALRTQVRRLISNEPQLAERLEVQALDAVGEQLYAQRLAPPQIAPPAQISRLIAEASAAVAPHPFSPDVLRTEWDDVVDAWQVTDWDAYQQIRGRVCEAPLPPSQQALLWAICASVSAGLRTAGVMTRATLFSRLAAEPTHRCRWPFDYVVVDEAQDLSVAQLRFLAALGANRPDGLFFAGDLGQRIVRPPCSWRSLGIDIRGRARTLRINYRTSHQIRTQADRLLGPQLADADGNTEERQGTVSAFNGPAPRVIVCATRDEEIGAVAAWLADRFNEGIAAHEIGVFVRSAAELARARASVTKAGLSFQVLDEQLEISPGLLVIGTMPLAKGLEFRAVAAMACDGDVIAVPTRSAGPTDAGGEVNAIERHLLYVACTRARDHLLVSAVEPASALLDDLRTPGALSRP